MISDSKDSANTTATSQQKIERNFDVFRQFVDRSQAYLTQNKYEMAAIYADMADEYASWMGHCGIFSSPELERILLTIGQTQIQGESYVNRGATHTAEIENVLHVVHDLATIGGHSRLIWRWIQQDANRSHSVVITRMNVSDVPTQLKDAVSQSKGKLYELTAGTMISRAKQLREIATKADIVVLHTLFDASISILAFANKEQSPPIIYDNLADERFWMGISISDVVANLRTSGMQLSQQRRGIEAQRNLLLPIPVDPVERQFSRADAKRQLGIDESSVMLLSIARAVKYKTDDGTNFADAHIALLKRHEKAVLVVIGPGDIEDWSKAIDQTQGRIRVLGETDRTAIFYQAADIYVDSFPFYSNTSLLEAGIHGTPLVSRHPYSSDDCAILGADLPGLTGNLIRVRDLSEYESVLSRLIEDEEYRLVTGERCKNSIEKMHLLDRWQQLLEEIYERAMALPRVNMEMDSKEIFSIEEPDVHLEKVFNFNSDFDKLVRDRARMMPLNHRIDFWLQQIKKGEFGKTGNISFLFSHNFYLYLKKHAGKIQL